MEQRHKPAPTPIMDKQGRLLLSEEECLALLKIHENDDEGSGSSGSKKRGKLCGRDCGSGACDDGSGVCNRPSQERSADKCCNCGKTSHWVKDCRSKPKKST